jgi:ABC-2 type transport system permease protein
MSTPSNAISESIQAQSVAPAVFPPSRAFYWSVRRELWENRSIYIAPLAVAAVAVFAFSMSAMAGIWEKSLRLDVTHASDAVTQPYDMAAGLMMLTGIIVSVFYCLDALHSERRDRSILFWKSLPVSDVTTVLAKASIPLVVLPLFLCAIIIAMQGIMLLLSSLIVLGMGDSVAELWTKLGFFRMSLLTVYHIFTAHALWPLPVYCWLLLVSGWARRATFLWAVLPLVAIGGVELIVFRSGHFAALVGSRLIGAAPAFDSPDGMFPSGPMTHMAAGAFLGSAGLWVGLVVGAVFLAAAVRLRRYQGTI